MNQLPVNIDSVIGLREVLLRRKLSFFHCASVFRRKKNVPPFLCRGPGQEGAPLNPLRENDDHYVLGDPQRVEI